jgi:hypothetical protein
MERLTAHHWEVLEALRARGFMVILRLQPDENDGVEDTPHCTIGIRGLSSFHGHTMVECINQLIASRCWNKTEELEREADAPRRVKVVDIMEQVETLASEYSGKFRADQIAVEMGVFPAAVGHALKKLKWPKSQTKTMIVVNNREVAVYTYLPR